MNFNEDPADQALKLAKNCRQYAMCKLDFLGTGVCASGSEKKFASYFPQGRMSLYAALAEGIVPVTPQAVQIADSCTLCGRCDYQCYFVTGMRPGKVMQALKTWVVGHRPAEKKEVEEEKDHLLHRMREIVGRPWAEGDPAITVAYSTDPCPLTERKIPRYVVLPACREEIAALLRLFKEADLPWTVRGNGTNILGFALGEGVIIDLNRMKEIVIDEDNWLAQIGPGVTAFELQSEAVRRGYRVNVAEAAAAVCSSIMTSGILSLFSAGYGTSASNVIDADFVTPDGRTFSLNDKDAPNLFAFNPTDLPTQGICVSAKIKLHPTTDDEEGVLIPFQDLSKALGFAKECAIHRLGVGIGILGVEYVSSFIAPTQELARVAKQVFREKLAMEYLVLVIADRFARKSIAEMGYPLIDQALFRSMNLGLSSLGSAGWLDLLTDLSPEEPYAYLKVKGFAELAETALAPTARALVETIDEDLRPFFRTLYERPELTDLLWLNMFRVTSSRIGREKHFFPILIYLPMDAALLSELSEEFVRIAMRFGVKHELGFITPVDCGKRCMFEYDYFLDQNDPAEIAALRLAAQEVGKVIEEYTARTGTIRWLRYLLNQGFCRMENFLYA